MQRYRTLTQAIGLALVLFLLGLPAHAFMVTVDANTTPWDIPINLFFAFGIGQAVSPAVVTNTDVPFVAGDHLLIKGSGGATARTLDFPLVDANGTFVMPGNDPNSFAGPVNADLGASGNGFPSQYMGPYPPDINLMELVGTFADSVGVIVGKPFFVGLSRIVTVPAGATRLQLGVNDDVWGDNGGSFFADVTITDVPEPSVVLLVLAGWGLLALRAIRRTR